MTITFFFDWWLLFFMSRLFVVIGDFRCWFGIAFKFHFLLRLCILPKKCVLIPLFDLSAIAIALKRLCEVWCVKLSRLFVVIVEFDFGFWFLCDYGVRLDCYCGCDCDCVERFARVELLCGECWMLPIWIFVEFVRLWCAQCYFIAPTLTCNELYSTFVRCFFVLPLW